MPGSRSGGISRNPRTGSFRSRSSASPSTSLVWPAAIEATCRTFIERLRGSVMSAANSGKCEMTVSSRLSSPSACANAAAVEVKLLLSEYSSCGRPAL